MTEQLEFIKNIYDPERPHARQYYPYTKPPKWYQGSKEAWQGRQWDEHCDLIERSIKGKPRRTELEPMEPEALEKMGMIGLYRRPLEEKA